MKLFTEEVEEVYTEDQRLNVSSYNAHLHLPSLPWPLHLRLLSLLNVITHPEEDAALGLLLLVVVLVDLVEVVLVGLLEALIMDILLLITVVVEEVIPGIEGEDLEEPIGVLKVISLSLCVWVISFCSFFTNIPL